MTPYYGVSFLPNCLFRRPIEFKIDYDEIDEKFECVSIHYLFIFRPFFSLLVLLVNGLTYFDAGVSILPLQRSKIIDSHGTNLFKCQMNISMTLIGVDSHLVGLCFSTFYLSIKSYHL